MSFSSDTGVAECMIIARRKTDQRRPTERAKFVSLRRRPRDFVEAHEVATAILSNAETRQMRTAPTAASLSNAGTALNPTAKYWTLRSAIMRTAGGRRACATPPWRRLLTPWPTGVCGCPATGGASLAHCAVAPNRAARAGLAAFYQRRAPWPVHQIRPQPHR